VANKLSLEEKILAVTVCDTCLKRRVKLRQVAEIRLAQQRQPSQAFNEVSLSGVVATVYTILELDLPPEPFARLNGLRGRGLMHMAIGYRSGFSTPPAASTPGVPAWVEPLFAAGHEAGLIPASTTSIAGWYKALVKCGSIKD